MWTGCSACSSACTASASSKVLALGSPTCGASSTATAAAPGRKEKWRVVQLFTFHCLTERNPRYDEFRIRHSPQRRYGLSLEPMVQERNITRRLRLAAAWRPCSLSPTDPFLRYENIGSRVTSTAGARHRECQNPKSQLAYL